MSTRRTSPGGWVDPAALARGPTGRPTCRWCGGEIPRGRRRTFCSQVCVEQHRVRTDPRFARHKVWERDRGVCQTCGLDTEYLKATVQWLLSLANARWRITKDCTGNWPRYRSPEEPGEPGCPRAERHLERLAREFFGQQRRSRWRWEWGEHLWEADHIVPVVEGGGECGIKGLRTLCRPCHRRATAELALRRAGLRPRLDADGEQLALGLAG